MALWHYSRQGAVFGPVTSDQLRDLARDGNLLPDDLLCRQGTTKWVPARRVTGLFPEAPPQPALPPPGPPALPPRPARTDQVIAVPPESVVTRPTPVPPRPVFAQQEPSPWARALLGLPKPVLFGRFGGAGGLLGALLLGELLWLLLSPSGLTARPHLLLGVPPAVQVYPGGKNRFRVKIARKNFTGPVRVEALSAPNEVDVPPLQIPQDQDQGEVEVRVAAGAAAATLPVRVQARAADDPAVPPETATVEVAVTPPPPALALAVSPRVSVDQASKARFVVRLARARFAGRVTLKFTGQPALVHLDEREVAAGDAEAAVDVSAPAGAATGETPVAVEAVAEAGGKPVRARGQFVLEVKPRPKPTVDVVFVLDLTGSMGFAIKGVKQGIQSFVEQLDKEKLDARIALVCFRDIQADRERPYAVTFDGEAFTRDPEAFRSAVDPLRAKGGGDEPESSLQALALAAGQPFRPRASRVLVLITDAPAKVHPGETISTVDQAVEELKKREIDQVHLMIREKDLNGSYRDFKKDFPGEFFDIKGRTGADAFAGLLPALSRAISRITVAAAPRSALNTEPPPPPAGRDVSLPPEPNVPTIKAVQSTQAYDAKDAFRLLVATVAWTMVVAACVSLFIVAGQQFHARQTWVGLPAGAPAFAGGLLAGLAGGAVGQLVFQALGLAAWEAVSRVAGWVVLGGLLGVVMAFFVPNLKWTRGMLGGLLGGLLGALAFLGVSLLGALPGRVLGSAVLGFCIGLMVALAELAFRRWWLEVAVSAREVRTVTLGTAAVTLGGDERLSSFFVAGAPPVALRYRTESGRVWCEDLTTGETAEAAPGDRRTLGKVSITVCSPASSQKTGYALQLSTGRSLPLQDGLPLTEEELPGLKPRGPDGIVALVGRHPTQPQQVQLRNRSAQSWSARLPDGGTQVIDPGRGVELSPGVQVNFGQVQGTIRADAGRK
jgi:Mg-chelatase subunit ChlD